MANTAVLKTKNTYRMQYRHLDNDNQPVSLTGHVVFFTAKPVEYDNSSDDSTAPVKARLVDADHTAWGGDSNVTGFLMTANFDPETEYYFDWTVRDPDGGITTPIEGTFTIDAHPTNRTT